VCSYALVSTHTKVHSTGCLNSVYVRFEDEDECSAPQSRRSEEPQHVGCGCRAALLCCRLEHSPHTSLSDVVCFLLGNSTASEFYVMTFRRTLFHPQRQVGVKNELGLSNVGVFIREKVWLENSLSQLAEAIFEPNFFPYKYPNISQT